MAWGLMVIAEMEAIRLFVPSVFGKRYWEEAPRSVVMCKKQVAVNATQFDNIVSGCQISILSILFL